mgnify:CR=1 FL=1
MLLLENTENIDNYYKILNIQYNLRNLFNYNFYIFNLNISKYYNFRYHNINNVYLLEDINNIKKNKLIETIIDKYNIYDKSDTYLYIFFYY